MNKKAFFCGPSHLTRWKSDMNSGYCPIDPEVLYWGKAGLPLYSKRLQDLIKHHYNLGLEVYILVPDFRFGNKIFNDIESFDIPFYSNDYRRISKNLISKERDILMYRNSLFILNDLVNNYPKIKLMFWDLFVREYENKTKNKYFINGQYKHPIWNYSVLKDQFSKNIVDISVLDNDLFSYIIDQQGHPSLKGYSFIINSFKTANPEMCFEKVENKYNNFINDFFSLSKV